MRNQKYHVADDMMDSVREAMGEQFDRLTQEERTIIKGDVADAVQAVHTYVFGYGKVDEIDTENFPQYEDTTAKDETAKWLDWMEKVLRIRKQATNKLEEDFIRLMDCGRYVSEEALYEGARAGFLSLPQAYQRHIEEFCFLHPYFWGSLSSEKGDFTIIKNRVRHLKEHVDDFEWLFERLEDYRSKRVLTSLLELWLTFDDKALRVMEDKQCREYFDYDLLQADENTVWADVGAYNGDTVYEICDYFLGYKKIYSFEASPYNYSVMQENIGGYPNVELLQKAVGEKSDKMLIQYTDELNVGVSLMGNGEGMTREAWVDVVSLDGYISERLDIIKMDIEGAEKSAIKGCAQHIKSDHPKLLISVYHTNEDIWKIAEMIAEIDDSYHFYLRCYASLCEPTDIVLYAT